MSAVKSFIWILLFSCFIVGAVSGATTFTMSVPTDGNRPVLYVQFTDTSTGSPSSWDWSFTDYSQTSLSTTHFSTAKNPTHYFGSGKFLIQLTTNLGTSSGQFININAGTPVATLDNYQIWPADHIYNTRIDGLPTLSNSATLASNLGSGNYGTVPCSAISAVDNNVALQTMSTTYSQGGVTSGRILDNQPTEQQYLLSGGDHSFDLVNPNDNTMLNAYSWYPPRQSDGTYIVENIYYYNLAGYDVSQQRNGIPIITQHDANYGLKHMIPATVENIHSGRVWPGASFGSSGFSSNTNFPTVGMIFRLKASKSLSGCSPQQINILNGLKQYGFIVDDKNDVGQGLSSPMQSTDTMQQCYRDYFSGSCSVTASDFEAVDVSSLMVSSSSGKVNGGSGSQGTVYTPAPTTVATVKPTTVTTTIKPTTVVTTVAPTKTSAPVVTPTSIPTQIPVVTKTAPMVTFPPTTSIPTPVETSTQIPTNAITPEPTLLPTTVPIITPTPQVGSISVGNVSPGATPTTVDGSISDGNFTPSETPKAIPTFANSILRGNFTPTVNPTPIDGSISEENSTLNATLTPVPTSDVNLTVGPTPTTMPTPNTSQTETSNIGFTLIVALVFIMVVATALWWHQL